MIMGRCVGREPRVSASAISRGRRPRRAIPGTSARKAALRSSAACSLPLSSAAWSASRCSSGMPHVCAMTSLGAIGRINARIPRAASLISPRRSCWGRPQVGPSILYVGGGPYGQSRLHNVGLSVDQGLWGHPVEVWGYDAVVRIEQGAHVVVAYPCPYDPRQRRMIAVKAHGRQQYDPMPDMQLVLWTLALARTVWRMPRYRPMAESRRVLLAPPISLWQRFAN